MRQTIVFTDVQPSVKYMKISDERADVIMCILIGESVETYDYFDDVDETKSTFQTVCQTVYHYDTNTFSVNPSEVTEEMITDDFDYYFNYEPNAIKIPTLEEEIESLKKENELLTQCILEMSEVIYNV